MNRPQAWWSIACACALAAGGCSRGETDANAEHVTREVAAGMSDVASKAGDQLADSWITTKIQAQYFADADVKARYLNVSTHDGVVTLKGRVDSEPAREQAVQIAKNTDGVHEVSDQLTVGSAQAPRVPERMDAAWMTTQIQARYFADPDVSGRDLNVSTVNGVVTVSGRVDTEPQKQLALSIARSVDGVSRVEDRVVVQPSTVATSGTGSSNTAVPQSGQVDDGRITNTIQSRYFMDDTIKGRRIEVDARQGVVTLRGEVGSDSERAQALLLARTTDGVTRVEDSLTVNAAAPIPSAPASGAAGTSIAPGAKATTPSPDGDDTVATRIQSKFFADPRVRTGSIDVSVSEGVVTLQGTVPDAAARKQALTIAQTTDGVTQVVDRIRVKAK